MQQFFLWHLVKDHHWIQFHLFISHNYDSGLWWLQSSKLLIFATVVYEVTVECTFRGWVFLTNRVTEWSQAVFSNRVNFLSFFFSVTGWLLVTTQNWQAGRPKKAGTRGTVKIPNQTYPAKPAQSGRALSHAQPSAKSFGEHSGRQNYRAAVAVDPARYLTLHRESSVSECLIAHPNTCGKCVSFKKLILFAL